MENNQSKDKSKIYLVAIIIILLLMNGYFIYHYVNTDRQLSETSEELVDSQDAKAELDKLLAESNEQLTLYKGKNAELDLLLEQKNMEIQAKAAEIEVLLKKGKISSSQLRKATEELELLRYYIKKYNGQIDSLTKANKILIDRNKAISDTLNSQKARNENLNMKNISLENKMNLGKKLSLTAISVEGVNRRSSGRETETNRAKRVDLVKIQFTLDINYLTDLGEKDFYARIISENGSTLSSEQTGGGTFKVQGDEALYSMKFTKEFDNTGQTMTFYYEKGSEWEKGDYKVELYADGFLIGSETLRLR